MEDKKFTPEEVAASLLKCASPGPCKGCIASERHNDCDCADFLKITAIEMIEELAAEAARLWEENRWTPVGERLPDLDDGSVLVSGELTAAEVLVMIDGAEKSTALYFDGEDFFDLQGDELIPYRVTHWRPMPKAPG